MAQFEGKTGGGEVFLGCTDGVPVTRKEMVECCFWRAMPTTETCRNSRRHGPLGKSMNNPQTREKLGWVPVHVSFVEFVEAGATDSCYPKRRKSTWK